MTKNEYMRTLAYNLRRLPKEDFDQAMEYFEEYFADAGPENEQQAIEDLGTPEEAAKELIVNLAAKNAEEPPSTVKRSFKAVWIGILGICAAPIALPIAFALLVAVAALVFAILAVLGALLLTAVCTVASAVAGGVASFFLLFTSFADGLATLGFALRCTGIGILLTYGMFLLCRAALKKLVQWLGRITKRGTKA